MRLAKAMVFRRLCLVSSVTLLAALGGAGTARAASFTVTTTADSSDGACTPSLCSLRDAIEAADSGGGSSTITLPAGSYKLTIPTSGTPFDPSTGDLDVDNGAHVTINGAGAGSTTVDADFVDRAFTVQSGAGLTLSGLTITNGQPETDTGIGCGICGGGIWSEGVVGLSGVTVTSSLGNGAGGAIYTRVGSTLSVTDSTFTDDNAEVGGAILTSSDSTQITGSTFSSNVAFLQGGAIQSQFGPVNITSSSFEDNGAGNFGGAIFEFSSSTVTVSESSFVDNRAFGAGGAIEDGEASATTLTDSRFVGNTAPISGALDVVATGGQVTLSGDEFDDNHAQFAGVAEVAQLDSLTATNSSFIGNRGGAGGVFQISTGTVAMTNVTMTHNTSPNSGGAIYFNAAEPLPVSLTNDTIADNSAAPGEGGGIGNTSQMGSGSGATGVRNTIIASNGGGDCGDLATSSQVPASVDAGFNLDSDGSCFQGGAATDKVGVNPLLGPPADNGGMVLTDALMPGSPAIDGGTDTGCPATDARGVGRPQGASCDIGAYEFQAAGLTLSNSAPATATTDVPFTYTLKATGSGPGLSTATTVVDQLPAHSMLFGATPSQGTCAASGSPAKLTCSLGKVSSGASATVDIVASVSQAGTATATASASNGEGANATASASTLVQAPVAPAGAHAPAARTGVATGIGKHVARLHGHVATGGQPTAYFFEYGRTKSLGHITRVRHVRSSSSVAAGPSHLAPGTVYRYRLVAVNDSGTSFGKVRSFKTRALRGAPRLTGGTLKVKHGTVSSALALLAKARQHELADGLSARLRTGQRGTGRVVRVELK